MATIDVDSTNSKVDADFVTKLLEYIKQVHRKLKEKINFETEDKRQAIYLLQGGAISTTINAFQFNLIGLMVPRAQQKRMINEILDLITFFEEIDDNSRQIKAWYKGHVISREPGNTGNLSKEERAKIFFLKEEHIKALDSLQKEMVDHLSKFSHPSINAMRCNMLKKSHLFDYDHSYTSNQAWTPLEFGNQFVVPTMHSLLLPYRTLPLSKEDFDALSSYCKLFVNTI